MKLAAAIIIKTSSGPGPGISTSFTCKGPPCVSRTTACIITGYELLPDIYKKNHISLKKEQVTTQERIS